MAGAPVLAYYLNDNLLTLEGARSATTNAFINDAEVRVTVVDRFERELPGQTWPLAMPSVGYSGIYRAAISGAVWNEKDVYYTGQIELNPGGSPTARWDQPIRVILRTN